MRDRRSGRLTWSGLRDITALGNMRITMAVRSGLTPASRRLRRLLRTKLRSSNLRPRSAGGQPLALLQPVSLLPGVVHPPRPLAQPRPVQPQAQLRPGAQGPLVSRPAWLRASGVSEAAFWPSPESRWRTQSRGPGGSASANPQSPRSARASVARFPLGGPVVLLPPAFQRAQAQRTAPALRPACGGCISDSH